MVSTVAGIVCKAQTGAFRVALSSPEEATNNVLERVRICFG
jgi:hypothetical protein